MFLTWYDLFPVSKRWANIDSGLVKKMTKFIMKFINYGFIKHIG